MWPIHIDFSFGPNQMAQNQTFLTSCEIGHHL